MLKYEKRCAKYNKDGRWRISGMADVTATSLPNAGGRDCPPRKKKNNKWWNRMKEPKGEGGN